MSRGEQKIRSCVDAKGYEHRYVYDHFVIVGYCNTRHLDMFYCKPQEESGGHFVYQEQYAMQFEREDQAASVINGLQLKNCTVEIERSEQNFNVFAI